MAQYGIDVLRIRFDETNRLLWAVCCFQAIVVARCGALRKWLHGYAL
jgi:hypothetical protein